MNLLQERFRFLRAVVALALIALLIVDRNKTRNTHSFLPFRQQRQLKVTNGIAVWRGYRPSNWFHLKVIRRAIRHRMGGTRTHSNPLIRIQRLLFYKPLINILIYYNIIYKRKYKYIHIWELGTRISFLFHSFMFWQVIS